MKLCVDCAKYGGFDEKRGLEICTDPRAVVIDPVHGDNLVDARWLRRTLPDYASCGLDGGWFMKKPAGRLD